jgi:integrase/recombinase XerD
MPWAARSVVPIVSSISKVITMTALRQQMENDMVLRGMAVRTRQSYIEAVRGLAKFYRRSRDQIAVGEVQSYLLHLLQERGSRTAPATSLPTAYGFSIASRSGRVRRSFVSRVPKRLSDCPRS